MYVFYSSITNLYKYTSIQSTHLPTISPFRYLSTGYYCYYYKTHLKLLLVHSLQIFPIVFPYELYTGCPRTVPKIFRLRVKERKWEKQNSVKISKLYYCMS
uniref:Uncharacterized protein n=1 Tax=Cacopsylla melanoneura TaxID=428564 RepID=A0A8D8WG59_9HEMI